ncbi:MAG: hypothetical protein K0R26_2629 [Bacteroidota bacterium]|jgi:hypothetical protein|nr:hypothetical protein [Bacteroidota bacterium]
MTFIKKHSLFAFLSIGIVLMLLYYSYYNEICEGGADNVWHYYFSKYALKYPDLFLHHWGKPLFILLSTGFAQFGFYGIKIFNILCGILAAIMVYKCLLYLNIKYAWLSIIVLIFSPIYFITLQSALTEPLFSLILITVAYLYLKGNPLMATCLLSFIIFSRSEGMFILLCYGVYLIISKQWKYLPLLGLGFVLYSIVGYIMGHNFFWYFTENPYQVLSPYGHGHFLDILKRYENIWGLPFLIIFCFGGLILFYYFIKEAQYIFWQKMNQTSKIFYLFFIPSMIFLIFHLYVWHYGLCGSAGLERVLASVFPCYVVVALWACDKVVFSIRSKYISIFLISLFSFFHIQAPFKNMGYPLKAWGAEKCEIDAAEWFKTIMPEKYVIYYAHPSIILHLDRDPFDKALNREQLVFRNDCHAELHLPTYCFWDSMFSESSFNVKPNDVENCNYKIIKEFNDGGNFKLIVYQKND